MEDGRSVGAEQGRERLEFLSVGLDGDLAPGGLFDGDVVVEDLGDLLESDNEDVCKLGCLVSANLYKARTSTCDMEIMRNPHRSLLQIIIGGKAVRLKQPLD